MAESLTDKLKLSKRDTGDINWGQGANANLDAVDQHAQQGTLRPPRTLLASLGSGAVGPNLTGTTTFFYKVTAINAAGETTEGKIPAVVEAQVTESAAPVPIILSWETVKGATGYKIYKSTLSGQEKFLAQVAGESTATFTDNGNTATNPAVSVPLLNTATTSVSKVIAGTGVSVNPAHGTGEVQVGNAGVTGVRKLGEVSPLVGDVKLEAGANIALTQDGIANKIVIAATGAGPAGYATVVVAAPTGVAATDRANIQNAINALPAAGGTVILREGNYVLDSGISFPVGKPVALIGQGPSTSISLTTLFEDTFPAVFVSAGGGNLERIVLSDFRFAGATRKALFIAFSAAAGQVFSDLAMRNLLIVNAVQGITLNATGVGGRIQNVTISDCHFVDPSASVITGQSAGGVITGVTISGTHTRKASGIAGFAMFIEGTKINFLNNYIEDQGFGGGLNLSGVGLTDSVIDGNTISAFICINIPTGATNFIRNTVISNNSLVVTGGGTLAMRAIGELSNSAIIGNRASHPIQLDLNAATTGNVIVANKAAVADNSGQANTVAQNFVTGVRKLGEAGALAGDVKLEAGLNVTLTQDAVANKITITAAAGGGGGYSTVIVAAPTGVAATDTANIQNAINSLPAAGGSVILREGNYVLNGNITLPASKPLNFMGQGKSTRITLDPTFAPAAAPFRGPATGTLEKLVMSDFEYVGGSNQANFLFFSVPAATVWSNMVFERIKFLTCATIFSIGGTGTAKRVWIRSCEAIDCQALVESSTWSDSFILNNYIEKQAILAHPAGIDLAGTNIVCKGNTVVWPDSTNAGNVPLRVATTFVKGSIEGNRCVGNRGLLVPLSSNLRQSVVADNLFRENTFGTDSILIQGEMSDCVVVGNNCEKDITLNANAASGGNVIAGNKVASINDNSGATTPNIVAKTLVSGLRKLGEAAALSGDVKLEPGSGVTITQDAAGNKLIISSAGGYATAVVAAPTLNAATDTSNIQAALDSLSSAVGSAGGGVVVLREGDYVVNQIIIRRDGTRLIGSGPGWSANSQIKSGTRIRGNVAANNLVKIEAEHVMVENITFVGFHVADGFSIVAAGADTLAGGTGPGIGQDLCFSKCAFTDIRSPLVAGIRASSLHRLRIFDCLFFLNESVQQTVARTPIGIKVGQAGSLDANLNVEIARCFFRHEYLIPGVGGSILAKDIEMTRVVGASIVDCHSLVGNAAAGLTHIFAELKQDAGIGKGVNISGNNLRRHNNFIKQTSAFAKVAVSANAYTDHQGTAPAIDLAGGNTDWAIVGNVIEGTVGINFQAGADNNVATANKATVVDAGTGNIIADAQPVQKIAEVTLSVNAAILTISGLDLDKHKFYKVLLSYQLTGISTARVFFNGDTVAANYWRQFLGASGATVSAFRVNNPEALGGDAGGCLSEITVTKFPGGKIRATLVTNFGSGAGLQVEQQYLQYEVLGNLTQITFDLIQPGPQFVAGTKAIVMKHSA